MTSQFTHVIYDAEQGDGGALLYAVDAGTDYPGRRHHHRQVHQPEQRSPARRYLVGDRGHQRSVEVTRGQWRSVEVSGGQ